MINFNNHNITEIHYNGHRIQRAIGCDGRVVWKYNKGGYENQYLTIIPKEDTDLILSGMFGTPCYYSFDSGTTWAEMQKDTPINVTAGQKVMFKKNHYKSTIGNISFPTGTFRLSSNYDVEGNVMSMAYGDDFYDKTDLSGKDTVFQGLFMSGLKSVRPPFTHYGSVVNAENLILPATTLASECYKSMFEGCGSLVAPPELPSMSLASHCYCEMFMGCGSLVTPPALPATTLAEGCYYEMFRQCGSLVKSPVLPAESIEVIIDGVDVTKHCYYQMFKGCKSLNEITSLVARRTDWSTENASIWADGVAETGTFYKNPACPSLPDGPSGIPLGWVVKDYNPQPPFSGKWLATYADTHTESAECDSTSAITNGEVTKENLVQIEIGECVTSIGDSAFSNASSLTSIKVWQTTPPTLGGTPFANTGNAPIYVPASSVELYKSQWSGYASRIQPIV